MVTNKEKFKDMLRKEHLDIMKKEIRYQMLHGKENDFYDLDKFNRQYVRNMNETHELVKIVQKELSELGWNTFLGFGDTGLYVYSTSEKPYGVF